MAGIKISQLPVVISAQATDLFPVVQSGVTSGETLSQVQTLFGFTTGILGIPYGGTGVGSVTITPTATAWAGWDSNKNLSANNFLPGYATTATSATTTTLTVNSAYNQYFTGATTQTVVLPVTSTLVLGQTFLIVNNSSGVVTVQSSGLNTIQAMAANTTLNLVCILTSGTTAASWDAFYQLQNTITLPLSLTNGGTNAALTASNGGIFYSTASAGAILSGTATANLPLLSGSTAAPTWGSFALSLGGALTTAGALTLSGAFGATFTFTGTTSVTFPTSGTLATVGQIVSWIAAPSTPVTAAINTGYYITDASAVTITLPVTAAAGSIVAIVGTGAGGWVLAPGSGQTIQVIGSTANTSITSAEKYDCIEVLCTVANTTWVARSLLSTGLTIS